MYRQLPLILVFTALTALVLEADDQTQNSLNSGRPVKPGPDDPQEKVKPGPIDKSASPKFNTTKSGLKYRILRKGGPARPVESDIVDIHYKGWLDDKTIYGSSYRSGKKLSFAVDRVIQGWTEGLQLVGKGGMIELLVPPKLGYGQTGFKGANNAEVPPNARLHFIIELFDMRQEIKVF